jgi:MFS family permease
MNNINADPNMKPIKVISLLTAACLIGDSMLYIVLPTHWREAGLNSLWEVGALLSVNRLVRLPLNPFVGWLYKRISTRSGIIFASLLAIITTAAYGLVSGFIPLLVVRCVWGLAWTFFRLGAYITVIDCSNDSNRGHCMGTYNGLFRLGSLAGMLVGGFLADSFGLRNTALVFSAIMFFAVPAAFFNMPRRKDGDKTQEGIKYAGKMALWKDSDILWALATGMLVAMIYQGMFTATLSYLVQSHNAPLINLFGVMIGAASLAGILQAMRWGWEPWLAPWIGRASDGKNGRRKILTVSLVFGGVLFMLTPLNIPLEPWLLVLIGLQLTATTLTTLTDAAASDAASRSSKVAVMTAYSLSIDLGAAVGPFAGYLLNSYVGIYASYWLAAVVLLLLAAVWFVRRPVSRAAILQNS